MEAHQILHALLSSDDEQPSPPSSPRTIQCPLVTSTSSSPSFKSYMFNIKYNIQHSNLPIPYLHRPRITLNEDSEPIYFMGKEYRCKEEKNFIDNFRDTIWMSYRENNGKSDAGWGCMIRVVQMVMAEAFKRFNSEIKPTEIVELFKEPSAEQSEEGVLSLGKICQEGAISNFIIMEKNDGLDAGRSLWLEGKYLANVQMYLENSPVDLYPKLIMISNKLNNEGSTNIPNIYIPHLKYLMKMGQFCGMIGGISNEALFIPGYQDENAIIMDPHYVQEESKVRYFKKTARGVSFGELCSSFCLSFYIKDIEDMKVWLGDLAYSCRVYAPYLGVRVEGDLGDAVEKYRKRSEDFQML